MERKIKNTEKILNYLYLRDEIIQKSDLIIGFGHFDMNIPRQCGDLFKNGYGKAILLTGGVGGGSADLKEPEAIEFKKEVINKYDFITEKDIIIETSSTNTGENILFSEKVLKSINKEFSFNSGIKSVIAVASPYRQRRVYLTMKKLFPNVKVYNSPSETNFYDEIKLFQSKNQNLVELIYGELERLILYPQKGFIEEEIIPQEIIEAFNEYKE
jgi:uncharacterized SAM-binding protein YcdF (DUF218 family)